MTPSDVTPSEVTPSEVTPSGRVLVLGGARSGKSAFAESLLAPTAQVVYVATAPTRLDDVEWTTRVTAHRERRPPGWSTLETTDLAGVFAGDGVPVLVDSVTAWLTAALDDSGVWAGVSGWRSAVDGMVARMVAAWQASARTVVAVTDEAGGGIVPESASARLFRDELGLLNQRLAAAAGQVWLVTAGIPQRLK